MRKLHFPLEHFPVETRLEIRFRDIDVLGHVNNAAFLSYLEMGRVEYLRRLSGLKTLSDSSFHFILGRVEIEYLSALTLTDVFVTVGIRLCRMRTASFDFEYALWAGEDRRLSAVAQSTQVMYDYQAKKAVRIADEFRQRVEDFESRRMAGKATQ